MAKCPRNIAIAFLWLCIPIAARADEGTNPTTAFLKASCYDCHQGDSAEAGLDLSTLPRKLVDDSVAEKWIRVFDRVRSGEMPPPDYEKPAKELRDDFVRKIGTWIYRFEQQEHAKLGRVKARRLTNLQLERTLHDLLGIDVPLAVLMNEEQRVDGFNNIAERQTMSHFQLESHLNVIDAALDAAFQRVTDDPQSKPKEMSPSQFARRDPLRRCREPEIHKNLAVVWTGQTSFYGRIPAAAVRQDGWYRLTVKASGLNIPKDRNVWCSVRSGFCVSGAPKLTWVGSFEAGKKPTTHTFTAWLPRGHMPEIRPADLTLKQARFANGQIGTGEGAVQNVPGVALHSLKVQRIHPGGELATVRKRLFGEMAIRIDHKKHTVRYSGKAKDKVAEPAKQLRRFAKRAFRRPVTEEQLRPYLQMLRTAIADGTEPVQALRSAYRALLCSPRFVYLREPVGQLDDHAIASRLSYFLTGSMPDWELSKLAQEGNLKDPKVLAQQVDRILSGNKLERFVRDFASQWLDLVDIDFTQPARRAFPTFDLVVQNSMLDETHMFLKHLIRNDLPASQLVNAKFTYLNSRLARYYRIEGDFGSELAFAKLGNDSHRGGLLAQGSILKITANGTNTSPVVRGVWVSERIMGQKIPPPPENVPAIEPDVRGTKTIRDMLAKHRSDDACASCHRKIDPPGFALENFDAAGLWRDRYLVGRRKGPKVDSGYELSNGKKFKNFEEFRRLIGSESYPIARNFAEKLMIYGTGAPIQFSDRPAIRKLVMSTEGQQFGLRSLIHAVVSSPVFLQK